MKLYIWSQVLETDGIHNDGSAGVVAASKESAIRMLRRQNVTATTDPAIVARVGKGAKPHVVFIEAGCDC